VNVRCDRLPGGKGAGEPPERALAPAHPGRIKGSSWEMLERRFFEGSLPKRVDPLETVVAGRFRAIKSRTFPKTSIGAGAPQKNQILAPL
jgi:hypothetical protein